MHSPGVISPKLPVSIFFFPQIPWFWALWSPLLPPDISWRRWSCKSACFRWALLTSQHSNIFLSISQDDFCLFCQTNTPINVPLPCSGFSQQSQPGISQAVLLKPIIAACWELHCTRAHWSPSFYPTPLSQSVKFASNSPPKSRNPSHPRASSSCCYLLGLCIPVGFFSEQKVWAWLKHPVLLLLPINLISFLLLWLSNKSITRHNCKSP